MTHNDAMVTNRRSERRSRFRSKGHRSTDDTHRSRSRERSGRSDTRHRLVNDRGGYNIIVVSYS